MANSKLLGKLKFTRDNLGKFKDFCIRNDVQEQSLGMRAKRSLVREFYKSENRNM